MKNLLLLMVLLSICIVCCNKEVLNNESYEKSTVKIFTRSGIPLGLYTIHNCTGGTPYTNKYVMPSQNHDMARVKCVDIEFVEAVNDPSLWAIESFNNDLVKFVSMDYGYFELRRNLDIDWVHPNSDGSVDAVMYRDYNQTNQYWSLIGSKGTLPGGEIASFLGVIVNKRTGQMLQLYKNYVPPPSDIYLIIDRQYKGSEEEKYFLEHGSFRGYCSSNSLDKSTIWLIHKED